MLAFLAGGLDDISVSRSQARARGWGIPVPDDPTQVIYVWWDALGNYITALDYGTDGDAFDTWWRHADERIHVIGKGIVRFHAVYWPAMLLVGGRAAAHDDLRASVSHRRRREALEVEWQLDRPGRGRRRGRHRRAALVVAARRAAHGRRRLHRRAGDDALRRGSRTRRRATSSTAS